jgi:hypothetical protein
MFSTFFSTINKDVHQLLLQYVKDNLSRIDKDNLIKIKPKSTFDQELSVDYSNQAYQELYELTQRKFLRQIIQFNERSVASRPFPRLLCIDLIEKNQLKKIETNSKISLDSKLNSKWKKIKQNLDLKNASRFQKLVFRVIEDNSVDELIPTIKPICEHEEGWHLADSLVTLNDLPTSFCPYLARMMSILKSGNLSTELKIFLSEQGNRLLAEVNAKAISVKNELDIHESYTTLRKYFINEIESNRLITPGQPSASSQTNNNLCLERCELKNGKILWLCKNHVEQTGARVLNDEEESNSNAFEQNDNKMLEYINNVKLDVI